MRLWFRCITTCLIASVAIWFSYELGGIRLILPGAVFGLALALGLESAVRIGIQKATDEALKQEPSRRQCIVSKSVFCAIMFLPAVVVAGWFGLLVGGCFAVVTFLSASLTVQVVELWLGESSDLMRRGA
jgi:hypothetical protein